MARFVFVTWNGGGNLTPALGIARVLAEHRHAVTFLGEETQRQRIEAAGLAFTAYAPHSTEDSEPPTTPLERQRQLIRDFWMNTALADDLLALLAREPADMVMVDCMLAGVLANSARFGAPTAVLVHSLYAPVLPMRDLLVMMGNQLRVEAGLPALDPATIQWEQKDLVLVTTLREFDGVTESAPNVRYVGPVFERQPMATDWHLPWGSDDPRPLVLASFSTMPGQTSPARLHLVLDALQSLPLRVVLTTGTVPPETLTPPANAAVMSYIPHAGHPAVYCPRDQPWGPRKRDGRSGPGSATGVYAGPGGRSGTRRWAGGGAGRGHGHFRAGNSERAARCCRGGAGDPCISCSKSKTGDADRPGRWGHRRCVCTGVLRDLRTVGLEEVDVTFWMPSAFHR